MNLHDTLELLRGLPQVATYEEAEKVVRTLDDAGMKIKAVSGEFHERAQSVLGTTLESGRRARDLLAEIAGRGFHVGSKE